MECFVSFRHVVIFRVGMFCCSIKINITFTRIPSSYRFYLTRKRFFAARIESSWVFLSHAAWFSGTSSYTHVSRSFTAVLFMRQKIKFLSLVSHRAPNRVWILFFCYQRNVRKKAEETWKCKFYGEFARSSKWNRKLDVRSRAQCTLSPAGEPKSRRNQIKSSSSSSVESGEKNYHQHDFTASDADDDDVDWIFGSEIFREMISGERMANEIIETTTC